MPQIIEEASTFKHFEVAIDEKLHWKNQINIIRSKVNKRLYFVRKLRQFKVNKTHITLFYKSAIESILCFCVTFWEGNISKGNCMKVVRIIKISYKFTTHGPHLHE